MVQVWLWVRFLEKRLLPFVVITNIYVLYWPNFAIFQSSSDISMSQGKFVVKAFPTIN